MRAVTISQKVRTNFGNIFCHLDVMPDGSIVSIAFSQPGKLDNSTIGNALDAISAAVNNMIQDTTQEESHHGKATEER